MANKKNIKFLIATLAIGAFNTSEIVAQTEPQGEVKVEADSMLDVITKNRVWNRPDKITGYRVLLYTGSRAGAQKVMQDFQAMFPDQPVMLKWDEPNFKVVGGLFYTKADAKEFRKKCSKKFPMLIIINDLVELPPVDRGKDED
jgi:hypothetical protein